MARTRSLQMRTIRRVLEEVGPDQCNEMLAAAMACKGRKIADREIKTWRKSWNSEYRLAALYARPELDALLDEIGRGGSRNVYLSIGKVSWAEAVPRNFRLTGPRRFFIEKLDNDFWLDEILSVVKLYRGAGLTQMEISEWLRSDEWYQRCAALEATYGRKDIDLDDIAPMLYDDDIDVRETAVKVLRQRHVSMKRLRGEFVLTEIGDTEEAREGLLRVMAGRSGAFGLVRDVLNDENESEDVLMAAAEACEGMNVPLNTIRAWGNSRNEYRRAAAMYAAIGRTDVPMGLISKLALEDYHIVRDAAYRAAWGRKDAPETPFLRPNMPIPLPERVYKWCLGGVIVEATIPSDAAIRGEGSKYRSNRAVITDVIGDFYGEKVGIAKYDLRTMYRVGDTVVVRDFDPTPDDCSTGFHFYLSRIEAEEHA